METTALVAEPILEKNRKIGNQSVTPIGDSKTSPPTDPPPDLTPVGEIDPLNQQPVSRTLGDAPAQNTALATPTAQTVNDNDLVKNNLNSLLDENSKYLQLARTGAAQQAASRGLLNSSIAAGAGENAAIRNALPIAQQDAQTHFAANTNTVNSKNRFAENQQRQNFDLARDYANAGYTQDHAILQGDINRQAQERDQQNALLRAEQAQGYNLQRDSINAGYTQDNMNLQADIDQAARSREFAYNLATLDHQAFIQTQRDNLLQGFQTLNLDQQQRNNLETIAAQFANTQEQARFEMGAQFQVQYLQASSNLQNAWSAEIQAIYSNPEMTPTQQANAVRDATTRYENQVDVLASTYAEMGAWNVVVDQFPQTDEQRAGFGDDANPTNPPVSPPVSPPVNPPGGGYLDVIDDNVVRENPSIPDIPPEFRESPY